MKPTTVVLLMTITVVSVQSQGFFGGLANFIQGIAGGRGNRGGGGRRPAAAQQSGGGRGGRCGNSAPNHSFGGQQYLVSWRLGYVMENGLCDYDSFFLDAHHLLQVKGPLTAEPMVCLQYLWTVLPRKESSPIS